MIQSKLRKAMPDQENEDGDLEIGDDGLEMMMMMMMMMMGRR
jgi:hypothetical protein